MKIALAPHQYLDDEGHPLVDGRVSVFAHGSDTPVNLYTLVGDDYAQAENPFSTFGDGRVPTYFFEASLVDVRVEKQNADGSFELMDTYEEGFAQPDVTNDTLVTGLEALKDTNPDVGVVTVVGYDNAYDAPVRNYVWDPTSTDQPDDGYVVLSNSTETGRWILLWADEILPASIYGVRPGHDSNLAAALSYGDYLGKWQIRTAQVVRFEGGVYSITGSYSTSKSLYFDKGAKFTGAKFTCQSAIVPAYDDYVADFTFLGQARAESGWFRTVDSYWHCRAKDLHGSDTNHFVNNVLSGGAGIAYQHISGKPPVMAGTATLMFNFCDIDDGALSTDWYVTFQDGMHVTDRWFADSNWAVGTRQLASTAYGETVELANFEDANVWLLFMNARKVAGIDLQGRSVGTITSDMVFTSISNGKINEAHFTHSVGLDHCHVGSLYLEQGTGTVNLTNVTANVCNWTCTGPFVADDCYLVAAANPDTDKCSFIFRDSTVDLSRYEVNTGSDSYEAHGSVQFTRCNVTNGHIFANVLGMQDCDVSNCEVHSFPVKQGEAYAIALALVGNTFSGTAHVYIEPTNGNGYNSAAHDCGIITLDITNNRFMQADSSGITMPFWAGPGNQYRFMSGAILSWQPVTDAVTFANWRYRFQYWGNTGKCPAAYLRNATRVSTDAAYSKSNKTVDMTGAWEGMDGYGLLCGANNGGYSEGRVDDRIFCLPSTPYDGGTDAGDVHTIADYAKAMTPYDPRYLCVGGDLGGNFFGPLHYQFTPECAWNTALDNDAFKVKLLTNADSRMAVIGLPANP